VGCKVDAHVVQPVIHKVDVLLAPQAPTRWAPLPGASLVLLTPILKPVLVNARTVRVDIKFSIVLLASHVLRDNIPSARNA